MSVSMTKDAASRASLVKPLAWGGIFGAAVFMLFALIEQVSPSQAGNKIINPALFQIENILEILGFVGWVLICFAFYQSGAAGKGWLAKIALLLAALGAATASVNSIVNAATIQNVEAPDWTSILLFGLVLFAPVLLGICALRTRMISRPRALYPILVVGIVGVVAWVVFGDINPIIPVFIQGFVWIGFAVLAMSV